MHLVAAVSVPDAAVVIVVVGARFLVPLLIPRFPLPAVLAALVLDAADQTIFQQLTDLDLTGYQSYDKALDIYYLSIAYVSVIRNWPDRFMLHAAMFLWYYRLVGVTLFELTEQRWLLLVFPNTFEYWFLAIEAVRSRYDPARLGNRRVVLIAAAIWIFVKLPQEWWIHVAQLDTTDLIKEDILGVSVDTSWIDAFAENLWAVALLAVLVVGAVVVVRAVAARLPTADWPTELRSDTVNDRIGWYPEAGWSPRIAFFGRQLLEKVVLVGLIAVIFLKTFPAEEASNVEVFVIAALSVVANAGFGEWRQRAGRTWRSVGARYVATLAVNLGAMWLFANLAAREFGSVTVRDVAAFAVMLAVTVTLYDAAALHRARCAGRPASAPTGAPPQAGL